jgi:hypothetical protein
MCDGVTDVTNFFIIGSTRARMSVIRKMNHIRHMRHGEVCVSTFLSGHPARDRRVARGVSAKLPAIRLATGVYQQQRIFITKKGIGSPGDTF